jgi:predicted dehydrogenase
MSETLKIGFVGLDTSHVSAFAKMLNDPANEFHVAGGTVVVGYPGGSKDFPMSINRVEGFTRELRDQWKASIVDSPEAVAEQSDLVFIMSVDGRVHLDQFKRIAPFKKPVFIDKPFTTSSEQASEILKLAKDAGIAVMSCSSLRYSQGLCEALAKGRQDIIGCDVYGPMNEEPALPGLFWYGCHSIEMLVTVFGVGCAEVHCVRTTGADLLTAVWKDGRVASMRGLRGAHTKFGATLHRATGPQHIDCSAGRPYYAGLLQAIMSNLPENRSAVPADEMLHVIQIIEAANTSRDHGGEPVSVSK